MYSLLTVLKKEEEGVITLASDDGDDDDGDDVLSRYKFQLSCPNVCSMP